MSKLISHFKELNSSDALIAGGKGASLGEMTQAGIPVPDGFVVLSTAFDQFIKDTDLVQEIDAILSKVNYKEIHTVENASEKIQGLIKNSTIPENIATQIKKHFNSLGAQFVAVRSSATAEDGVEHAWAGQLDSYLNTTERDLLKKVQNCWASLFTPRAIFYRFEKGLHATKISVAVVVQKMVNSEVSGIAFSVHPVTEDRNQLIIEAGFGLGEAIVSGSITPDSYVIEKEPRSIIDISTSIQRRGLYRFENGGNKWIEIKEPKASSQVLNEIQILELSEMIIGIENHYGFPCDVEWAFECGKFYIVQSRPITTLSKSSSKAQVNTDRWLITRTRHIPSTYPLLAFFDWQFNEYFKLDDSGHVINVWDNGEYFAIWEKSKLLAEFSNSALELLLKMKNFNELRNRSTESGEILVNFCKKYAMSEKQLTINCYIDFLEELSEKYANLMRDNMCYWLFAPSAIEKRIRVLLREYSKDQIDEIVHIFSHPEEESYGQKVNKELNNLVVSARKMGIDNNRLIKRIAKFSENYFWFPYEYVGPDIWSEEAVIRIISDKISDKDAICDVNSEGSTLLHHATNHKYKLSSEVKKLFSIWQMMSLLQDDRKMFNAQVSFYLNDIIANRASKDFSIAFEQARYLDGDILKILQSDRKKFDLVMKERMQFFIVDQRNGSFIAHSGNLAQKYLMSLGIQIKTDFVGVDEITGQVAYKGLVTGRVRILKSSQVDDFVAGDIIVTGMTTPDFVPLIKKAGAIITNEGGITCHAAIIAREMKKPCIIGAVAATKILKDGDFIEVDANNGVVRVIKKAN